MRMYFLVMYNLSGIQKGIQAGHAVEQYALENRNDPEYNDYVENHKTWIILDGGGSGEMSGHLTALENAGVICKEFREPDLNNSISAICFLVPSCVYDAPVRGGLAVDDSFPKDDQDEYRKLAWLSQFLTKFNLARG